MVVGIAMFTGMQRMLRTLFVVGLALATLTPAEARGFRMSFRPRLSTSPRLSMPRAEPRGAVAIGIAPNRRYDDRLDVPAQRAATSTSVLDGIGSEAVHPLYLPAADTNGHLAAKKAVPSAHWCDNGSIVGTGSGFCVVKISAGAPT